jgi:CBS domain containing-hemolysin-like protein
MSPAVTVAVVVIVIAAGAGFFFALAETALFSLGKWQIRQLSGRSPLLGGMVEKLLAEPQDLLAMMVLGNTFATAAMLFTSLWMVFQGHWPTLPTMSALFGLILLGGEVLPKTLAVRRPEQWALRVARPLLFLERFALPLRLVAQKFNASILAVLTGEPLNLQPALTDEEYRELLELAHQQGTLALSEKEIILQIINLDRRTVKEVMQPRSSMACIRDDLSVDEMLAAARHHKHRRLPMFDETPDTIVGILNTRALLLDPKVDLAEAIELPSFVPETMNLLQLLKRLQRQQRGIAVVMDEFGGTAGLVTSEDIFEAIVGKIRRETGEEGFVAEKLAPGRWRVNATMRLDDFRREYPPLGMAPEVETIGGLVMSLLGVVPAPGESITFRGLKLTVEAADERRIRELLVELVK